MISMIHLQPEKSWDLYVIQQEDDLMKVSDNQYTYSLTGVCSYHRELLSKRIDDKAFVQDAYNRTVMMLID